MNFQDGDSSLYVSNLLNIHADALGEIFYNIFRVIIAGVRLQHFNRNQIINSYYVQFTVEHTQYPDFIYTSRNLNFGTGFNYNKMVSGVLNWLANLSQSSRMTDISKDWAVCLLVSRTEEVPRGMGKPLKKNDAENEQFPVSVEVQQLDSAEDYQDSLPESGCKNFAPSTVVTVRTEKNSADDEEYQLFGTLSLQSSVDGEVQTENTSNHTPASSEDKEDEPQVEDVGNEESDEEEDEMDDDSGTLFPH